MSKHALLSPSSSSRWINCIGSVLLPDTGIEKDTTAADEGTLAHKMAELKLNCSIWDDMEDELNECRQNPLYKPEMDDHTTAYVNFINNFNIDKRLIEKRVEMDDELFGTCDCILFDQENNKIIIVDFKYGFGKVEAQDNSQMRLYGLGAAELLNKIPPGLDIEMWIYQPRINNISSETVKYTDLLEWYYDKVFPAILKFQNSKLEEKVGSWCKYCDKKILCQKYNDEVLKLEDNDQIDFFKLSDIEIAEYYERFKELENHIKDIKTYLIKELNEGKEIPGYKLSTPKNRYWKKSKKLEELTETYNLYNVMTVAQAEKKLGKEKFEELLQDYVSTKDGTPRLIKVKK